MTWSRVILDPFLTILSHAAAELQPMIRTSLMTLSLNSSSYSEFYQVVHLGDPFTEWHVSLLTVSP